MNTLLSLFEGFISLLSGMRITFAYMFKKPVTISFPKKDIVSKYFKGPIGFVVNAQGNHQCIACNACIKACPSRCMALKTEKNSANQRILTDFKVEHTLCSLCSICIAVCPTDALKHEPDKYLEAALTRPEMLHDLLEPFRRRGVDLSQPVKMPAKAAPAEEKKP